ncbi:MAG TPA: HAMP domain-containing protein [Pseudomonas xinjiangensis]|uniref:histidine kinase n=2 Tax=root TaxID=1 RepID=A0A7V1BQG4_9GAMM|nr:HAMP domain-containing protein [Halopseudomonas xinjiangensis]HEC48758.1 HAMP domain-containing protein [Halopseudomonas xinjiangensis]
MNSIFFRIYGGMLLVLITVSLLALVGIRLLNDVRAEDYRERIASGTFRLMADNLAPMDDAERLRALAAWTRLIGVPLELRKLDELGLESAYWARLIRGQVLVRPEQMPELRIYALVDLPEGVVLTTSIQRISEQLGRATLYLIADELVRHPETDMPKRLQRLRGQKGFGYPLQLTQIREADLDADQRRRLEESDTVMTLGPDGDSVVLYMKIPDSNWVLSLGPLYQMNDYPPEMLLITGVLVLTLTGLLIYLLVRQLEQRLLTLEAAASHITRGNLDARVESITNDSVGRLARTFNEMASHLQRLMRIQQEMIGAVSHELRTPVARLRFGLEMVETTTNEADRRRYMDGMDGDLSELDKLVDEILTYARLEQGAPALTLIPTNIPELVDHVVAELTPLGPALQVQHHDRSLGQAREIDAEARYLQRALTNLVTNAMRHAVSRVVVTTWVEKGRCMVVVEDDGPGIPPAYRERIFTPFLRLDDSRTRSSGGYGLGLSIVRRIIYWHQGRARVEQSQTLGGAAFVLDWPVRRV